MSRRTVQEPWIRRTVLALALGVLLPVAGSGAEGEALDYRWRLGGFKGFLARLVVPGSGRAVLRTTADGAGGLVSELHITSPDSRRGEFWRYRAEIESADCDRISSAATEQFFRGRAKEKRAEIDQPGVLDIPSCICLLRRRPPDQPYLTRIWSDGRIYPVRISLRKRGRWRFDGRQVATRTYAVEGVRRPDERLWKGRLELVLADDEVSTPLEIAMVQTGLAVRLVLIDAL